MTSLKDRLEALKTTYFYQDTVNTLQNDLNKVNENYRQAQQNAETTSNDLSDFIIDLEQIETRIVKQKELYKKNAPLVAQYEVVWNRIQVLKPEIEQIQRTGSEEEKKHAALVLGLFCTEENRQDNIKSIQDLSYDGPIKRLKANEKIIRQLRTTYFPNLPPLSELPSETEIPSLEARPSEAADFSE